MRSAVRSVLLTLAVLTFCPSAAHATFLDLRGIVISNPNSIGVSLEGVSVSLSGSVLASSPTRFGINSAGDNDVPDLFDGGNGFAESAGFSFGPLNAVLESIVISDFDGVDAGIVHFKSGQNLALHDGVNLIPPNIGGATSLHSISWTGPNEPGGTRGFSLDGFNLRLVPEPSSLALATYALAFCLVGMRRRLRLAT